MRAGGAVALRPVPFPCRAMLAIANDVDEAAWDDFSQLHDFLNGCDPTPLGGGLGLEIGDSFFFYATSSPDKRSTFSYFDGVNPDRRMPWAGQMDALIEAGYLDSLHSWGDFSRTGGFTRGLAESAAEVLRRRPVTVWINHGDARNEQMAGRPGWDDPAAPHGHADVAIASGLRYFWTGALTSTIGQDAVEGWAERLNASRLLNDFARPLKRIAARDTNIVRYFGNRLMVPASAAGRTIQVFQRYGAWDKPTALDLEDVLSSVVLDGLESRGGFMIVYTHLFRRPAGMPLDRVDWSPIADLARRHRAGTMHVTTTSRLLAYADMRANVAWDARPNAGGVDIHVSSRGAHDLQGLTFYVPDARRASVTIDGDAVTVERNPPDHTGRPSVTIPWRPLRWRSLAPAAPYRLAAGAAL